MKYATIILILFLAGCGSKQIKPDPVDSITFVPVCPEGTNRIQKPTKPVLSSSLLTIDSTHDEVVKAAITDITVLIEYSESLERLIIE
jgi:hypothetical protein